jgi:DNA-binding transcriptional LysR family regulator
MALAAKSDFRTGDRKWTYANFATSAQIVASGSLSNPSRQLFIAQPVLSQQLCKFEGNRARADRIGRLGRR